MILEQIPPVDAEEAHTNPPCQRDGDAWRFRDLEIVALLTVFAFAVRWIGLDHLLPHRLEPDRQIAQQVILLELGAATPDDALVMPKYPWLLARLAGIGFRLPRAEKVDPSLTVEQHLELCSAVSLRVRQWVAWLGVVAVPLVWCLAREILGRGPALLATALFATSLLHMDFSQQARPHVPAATFALLATWAAARSAVHGGWRSWCLAAASSALAVGTLQSGVATLVPLASAAWIGLRRGSRGLLLRLSVLTLAVLGALLAFYPFLGALLTGEPDSAPGARPRMLGSIVRFGSHSVDFALFDGGGFASVLRALWMYDPLLLAGLLVGACLASLTWIRRERRRISSVHKVALAYALPYLFAIGMYERTYQRFVIPLLPFVAILAAHGWSELVGRLPRRARRSRTVVLVVGLFVLVGVPAATSARLAWLRRQPDTLERLASWMEREFVPRQDAAAIFTSLPLPPVFPLGRAIVPETGMQSSRVHWHDWQARVPDGLRPSPRWRIHYVTQVLRDRDVAEGADPLARLRSRGIRYLFHERRWPPLAPEEERPLDRALKRCRLVLRLSPDATKLPLDYNEERQFGPWRPNHAWRVWTARCCGPAIDVRRVP